MNDESRRVDDLNQFIATLTRQKQALSGCRDVLEQMIFRIDSLSGKIDRYIPMFEEAQARAEAGEEIPESDIGWIQWTVQYLTSETENIEKRLRSGEII